MSQDIVNYFYCSQLKSNASEHAWVGVTLAHITCQGKMASLRDQKELVLAKLAALFVCNLLFMILLFNTFPVMILNGFVMSNKRPETS